MNDAITIDYSETIALAQALIACPSVTPNDAGCQPILIERLARLGLTIEPMPYGQVTNLWARLGTTAPVFCFAGHTDVVPAGGQWQTDPFVPTIRDGYLYGRGAADMKGSLAAMIVAAEQFLQHCPQPRGSLAFLITSDEEGEAVDGTVKVIEKLQSRNEQIDYCLVGEPSSRQRLGDQIKHGRRGSLNATIQIQGRQGHIAYPHLADNPIHRVAPALMQLCQLTWDQGNRDFPPTQLQISNIHAGTGAENQIPEQLTIQLNIRFSTAVDVATMQQHIERVFQDAQVNYSIQWRLSGMPFITAQRELVTTAQHVISETLGYTPQLSTDGGTSDGRFIALTGAQVIELGPINATIHQVNECVATTDLEQLTVLYTKMMQRLLG
jgi:succinyl-diaminopimelate desuccinylase